MASGWGWLGSKRRWRMASPSSARGSTTPSSQRASFWGRVQARFPVRLDVVWQHLPGLLKGAGVTLELSALSIAFALGASAFGRRCRRSRVLMVLTRGVMFQKSRRARIVLIDL